MEEAPVGIMGEVRLEHRIRWTERSLDWEIRIPPSHPRLDGI